MTDNKPQPVTAAELMARVPLYEDYPCEAWGRQIVRVMRLDPAACVALTCQYELYQEQAAPNKVPVHLAYAWGCDVVAASVVDAQGSLQFADGQARQWLATEPDAVRELLRVALRLSKLGSLIESDEDEAEKKSA